jgi:hypothetical protein
VIPVFMEERPALKRATGNATQALAEVFARRRAPQQVDLVPLPLETEDQLRAYMLQRFGVRIPDVQVCPNHSTPWRAFAEAFFARVPVSVWKASRGLGGKSYLLAALGLVEAAALGADVKILGGSGEQAKRVHEAMQGFWWQPLAPRELLESDPTGRSTRLSNGARIEALLASQASVRGPHPQRFRADECDEMEWDIFEAARGMPQDSRGILCQTVLSSTHQYEDGTMTAILDEAEREGWPVHEWCAKESMAGPDAWLTEAVKERKRATMSAESWNVEVELQRPNAEARAISGAAVDRMFRRDLGEFKGDNGEYIEIEGPQPNADYAHGADWGRRTDWCIIWTFRTDVSPARLVAFERRGRTDWPDLTALLDDRQRRFGGRAKHDGTGLGDVIDQFLQVRAEGVWLAGKVRQELFSGYVLAIEAGKFEAPFIEWAYKEHKRCTHDDLYGAGHPPDSIVAGSLAASLFAKPGASFSTLSFRGPQVDLLHPAAETDADRDRRHLGNALRGSLIGGLTR